MPSSKRFSGRLSSWFYSVEVYVIVYYVSRPRASYCVATRRNQQLTQQNPEGKAIKDSSSARMRKWCALVCR